MTPRQTLMAQTSGLLESVDREVVGFGGPPASAGFPEVVLNRLMQRLDTAGGKLRDLLQDTRAGGTLSLQRRTYREVEAICRDLFAECLAARTVSAIRALNLDGGASGIVERLLEGLGKDVGVLWPHVTVLAEAEFFATASKVIRLRYPASGIWDVPVAAHEFGHLVGPLWETPQGAFSGYQKFLGKVNFASKEHREEYFADLFATFTLGPAFVSTCLLHRFDPGSDASTSHATHPSDAHRAVWMLMGLELLVDQANDQESKRQFEWILKQRREDWEDAVVASGGVPLDAETATELRMKARDLWLDLAAWAGGAAYKDIRGALRLRAAFLAGETMNVQESPSIRDILNAAWLLRLSDRNDANNGGNINLWAHQLCLKARG